VIPRSGSRNLSGDTALVSVDGAEQPRVHGLIRIARIQVVRKIESFSPQLKRASFANRKRTRHGHVQLDESRSRQRTKAHIDVRAEIRKGKRGLIQVANTGGRGSGTTTSLI